MGKIKELFLDSSRKEEKKRKILVSKVLALEKTYESFSDESLREKTKELKTRIQNGEEIENLLPEAFANVREAAKRVVGLTPFPVQILAGAVLFEGKIAEMKTGEGKTLVETMPAYLHALSGKGVHIITVNEYLAQRDREWMGKIFEFLGLSVGCITHDMNPEEKRAAYSCDITYGMGSEFVFDYLRDNQIKTGNERVQRGFSYAIVDEVDSILIDEARTPLILSGAPKEVSPLYEKADLFAKTLSVYTVKEQDRKKEIESIFEDILVDEKAKSAALTPSGVKKAEEYFKVDNLMDFENREIYHHILLAIKANTLMKKDRDYVVKDGEIKIVDEFTGRILSGRRFNDGLHGAIEIKEGVTVKGENRIRASITFQNFFRKYEVLSGMTGTAMTEKTEFMEIYGLDVIEIPTNRPVIRKDLPDVVYKTEKGKMKALADDIFECYERGQPVLCGTVSVEKSEKLSQLLCERGIPHQVLNAKDPEKEAEIIAKAGAPFSVTIATNMAGRGTDIKLEKASRNLGGLYVIGTERHESRRIDSQLRGRSGRQGDPGMSRFYLSLEDDLLRLFGGNKIEKLMENLNLDENTPIQASFLSSAIETAQKRLEEKNFGIRKNLLKFDDILNEQRETIYRERNRVLSGENLTDEIDKMRRDTVEDMLTEFIPDSSDREMWDFDGLSKMVSSFFHFDGYLLDEKTRKNLTGKEIWEIVEGDFEAVYRDRENKVTPDLMREIERQALLKNVDSYWMEQMNDMEELKNGIGLCSYAGKDPVGEYLREGMKLFEEMNEKIRKGTIKDLYNFRLKMQSAE